MPNHYQNVLLCFQNYEHKNEGNFDCKKFVKAMSDDSFELFERLMPEPTDLAHPNPRILSPDSRDWRYANWGTKWGPYEWQAIQLKGDCAPVMIAFCTAWSPPSEELRRRIDAWLKTEHGMKNIAWAGLDPYDVAVEQVGGEWTDRAAKFL